VTRERHHRARGRLRSWPRSTGVASLLIDPVLVVPQHSMPSNGAGMTGNRVSALPSRSMLRTWRRHLMFLLLPELPPNKR
jgi:hypothetical protein